MSAPKSETQKLIKRFGKVAANYQERIDRQVKIIDRLVAALTVATDAIEQIADGDGDAVEVAVSARERVKAILEVPNDNEEKK